MCRGNSGSLPEIIPQNTWQLSDTVSWTRGAHTLSFGFSVIKSFRLFSVDRTSGSLSFTGAYTNSPASPAGTGAGFADFLLGLPVSAAKSMFPEGAPYVRYGEYGGFAQDQWRATRRLTLNVGLRYDLFTPVSESTTGNPISSDSGTLVMAGQNGISSSILHLQKHDFSPRIGLPTARRQDRVRAAYGLFYFNEEGTGGSTRLFINYPLRRSSPCPAAPPRPV